MMQLLSYVTFLFEGEAIPYKLYFDPKARKYFFKPGWPTLRFPSFYAWSWGSCWHFEPSARGALRRQAIAFIEQAKAQGPVEL